nr:LacI family DNA-binding transcriptional regulator [uncultured Albidiferax sp.]
MASIKDVARHANVSISTVSHVVNRTRFVSDKARQDVEAAIRALGYVPSAVARSLKSNTTRTLGMLIPNCSNPYFAEIVRSVEDHCFASGYTLILCNTDDEPLRQSVYLKVLAEKRVDGLIIISTGEDSDLQDLLQGLTTPTVLLDREVTHVHCDLVETANVQGGQMATEHLVALGHRRIACIGGPAELSPSAQRIQGWRNALAAAALDANDLLWHSDFSSQGGFTAMQAILQSPQQPTAVFVCNDLMGIGALSAAHEAGLRIPQDLSIIGFDDIELARFTSPPLTTIVQPKQRIGMLAVDMLLERIQGGRTDTRQVLLQPELIVRASTASPTTP